MKFLFHVIVTLCLVEFGICLPHDSGQEKDDDCDSLCSDDFTPICGSTGRTYLNVCHFECATQRHKDLTKIKDGACPNDPSHHKARKIHCHCRKTGEPVCGTNGVTYGNLCLLKCAHQEERHIKIKSHSACEGGSSGERKPVALGHSGKSLQATYVESTTAAVDDGRECVCPRIYLPVCGTNDIKYSNMCELRCVMAKNSSVSLKNKGRCVVKDAEMQGSRAQNEKKVLPINENGECVCASDLPVKAICGSNGKTFPNECEFNCAEYKEQTLYMVNEGSCVNRTVRQSEEVEVQINPEGCKCAPGNLPASDNEPVCSGDNVTYMSKCALLCEKQKYPSVRLSFCGPCSKTHKCRRNGKKNKMMEE